MHGNSNFERIARKSEARPPRGNDVPTRQEVKRGKQWTRENKRDQWTPFPVTDLHA